MVRRVLILSTVSALVGFGFVIGAVVGWKLLPGGAAAHKVAQVQQTIRHHYPQEIDPGKLERAAVEGMLKEMDPWCEYFTAEEWREWQQRHMSGKFHGVGIRVDADVKSGYMTITSPIRGSPAFEADILPGDLILEVNGVDIRHKSLDEVVDRIKGAMGTPVKLTLRREGREPFAVNLTRAEIKIDAVTHRMAVPEAGLGYVRISEFTESVPGDVEAAVKDLHSKGLKALVIDLRFNGGGLLSSAVDLCDLWLPSAKTVAISEAKSPSDRKEYRTKRDGDLPSIPLVVLVNRSTASASEIVAGALRDHGRAPLVGSRTFGKGLVQTPFDLSDGSHLKLTTARWLTPNGEQVGAKDATSEGGLKPEFLVEMTREEETAVQKRWAAEEVLKGPPPQDPPPKDHALEAGIEILRAKLQDRPPKVERREVAKTPAPGPQ